MSQLFSTDRETDSGWGVGLIHLEATVFKHLSIAEARPRGELVSAKYLLDTHIVSEPLRPAPPPDP
jgi:hypothetical protein